MGKAFVFELSQPPHTLTIQIITNIQIQDV